MSNNKKPVKIIIQYSKEVVNFADFINEVIDFEDESEKPEDKQTSPRKLG
jgi:hypothetical protein